MTTHGTTTGSAGGAIAGDTDQRFGGFWLGAMQLALPMAALREVVPLTALVPLPSAAACVRGGIRLRGVTVPVLDLGCVLGLAAATTPPACPSVIVMVHGGRILGLLADGVSGVFGVAPGALHRMHAADPLAAVLAGSLLRTDDGTPVSLLSAAALAALPQVPMVEDPEPARQQRADDTGLLQEPVRGLPMMLMRCGPVPLAIDAMAVHATVADPQLEPSVLAMGHCRGVIDFAGQRIPALDLLALCGLGSTAGEATNQAFVMRLPAGLVALLVSEVDDVVRVMPDQVVAVPAFALPRPELIGGALPVEALPPELVARLNRPCKQYLVVQEKALAACADMQGASAANAPGLATGVAPPPGALASAMAAGHAPAGGSGVAHGMLSLVTYSLGAETASPIDQVAEILPYRPEAMVYQGQGHVLGMVINRGQAIPVVCLGQLLGGPPVPATPSAAVLVVAGDGVPVGFAVPQLSAIESTRWQPGAEVDAADRSTGPCNTRQLALVGSGSTERLLPVLDLSALARQLRGPQALRVGPVEDLAAVLTA